MSETPGAGSCPKEEVGHGGLVGRVGPGGGHWQTGLPDSEITVLLRFVDHEDGDPVWLGYHDGEQWRLSCATPVEEESVLGWMHLHEATALLDAADRRHHRRNGRV